MFRHLQADVIKAKPIGGGLNTFRENIMSTCKIAGLSSSVDSPRQLDSACDVHPRGANPLDLGLQVTEGLAIVLYYPQTDVNPSNFQDSAVLDPRLELVHLVLGVCGQVHSGIELSYIRYAPLVYPPLGYILSE